MPRGGGTKETSSKAKTKGNKTQNQKTETNNASEPECSKPDSIHEAPGEYNMSMSELIEIIETKTKQLFEDEIRKLKSEVQALNKQVETLSHDRDAQKKQNEKLWFEINKRALENQELKMKIDTLEQDTKMKNVRVVNFPEVDDDKNIKTNIETMANDNLKIEDFEDTDVVRTWRLGRVLSKKPRDLIISFSTREKRDQFYAQCKKTKVKLEDGSPLYVNEDLTSLRSKLFYDSRRLVKAKKLHSTWTQNGNIMVKTTDESRPTAIYNHDELRTLLYEIFSGSEEENSDFDFED